MINRFLTRICTSFILLIMGLTIPALASNDNYEVSILLVPRATYFLSPLLDTYKNRSPFEHMASIQIVNKTSTPLNCKLRVQVFLGKLGFSEPFIDVVTVPANTPFLQNLPAGTTTIQDTQFDVTTTSQYRFISNTGNLQDRFISAYGKIEDIALKTSDMLPADTLKYRVYLLDASGSDDISNALDMAEETIDQPFEMGNIEPITPQIDEELKLSNSNPTFIWKPLLVRTGVQVNYRIQIRLAGPVSSQLSADSFAQMRKLVDKTLTDTTTFDYPSEAEALKPDNVYYWQVTATDEMGYMIGKPTDGLRFKFTMEKVTPAQLNAPSGEIKGLPIGFRWTEVVGAKNYQLDIAKDPAFAAKVWTQRADDPELEVSEAGKFEPGKPYFWRIQAYDEMGQKFGPASDPGQFTVAQTIDLLAPVDAANTAAPVMFSWKGLDEANSYQLELGTAPDLASAKKFTTEGTSLTIANDEYAWSPETRYYWRITALRDNKIWGALSAVANFSTWELAVPALISPVDVTLTDTTPKLTFKGVNWADKYQVQISTSAGSWDTATKVETRDTEIDWPASEKPLDFESTRFWRVIPFDIAGKSWNKSSDTASFSGPSIAPINLIQPVDTVLSAFPVAFQWTSITGASQYQLRISQSGDASAPKLFVTEDPKWSLTEDEGVAPNIHYFWSVQALDATGKAFGKPSVSASFKVQTAVSEAEAKTLSVDLISPLNDTLEEWAATLRWMAFPGAKIYEIKLGTVADLSGAGIYSATATQFNTEENSVQLKPGVYYWQVQAKNDKGPLGVPSKIGRFTVANPTVTLQSPVNKEVDSQDVTFKWDKLKGAKKYQLLYGTDSGLSDATKVESDTDSVAVKAIGDSLKYFWRVQALLGSGDAFGNPSTIAQFTIKPPKKEEAAAPPPPKANAAGPEMASPADINNLDAFLKAQYKDQAVYLKNLILKKAGLNGDNPIPKKWILGILDGSIKITSVRVN